MVIAIIGILAALLLPALANAKVQAKAANCRGQMRQILTAYTLYTDEHQDVLVLLAMSRRPLETNNALPASAYTWWPDLLKSYVQNPKLYTCPGQRAANGIGLNHNELGLWGDGHVRMQEVARPSSTVAYADVGGNSFIVTNFYTTNMVGTNAVVYTNLTNSAGSIYMRTPHSCQALCTGGGLSERHARRLGAGFLDGHVQSMTASEVGLQFPNGHAQALWDKR